MRLGVFYGIGVGPGDPELITVKALKAFDRCRYVFVPVTRMEKSSTALSIARNYLRPDSQITELVFPMIKDSPELSRRWDEAAQRIADAIGRGEDACFLTLGDPLLYSTYIYLLRALRREVPNIDTVTIPGITAFSAAAALTEFAVGEGNESVRIVSMADDLDGLRETLLKGGTVVLMKVGKHLSRVLELMEQLNLLDRGVFVSRAGLDGELIEHDLRKLREKGADVGYFSILLVHAGIRHE